MPGAIGGEVSGEVLAAGERIAAYLGVPLEQLYGPYRHFIDAPPARIDWNDYVALKQITAELAGSDEALVAIGNCIIDTPKIAAGSRALALFVDPALAILKASKNGWGRLYTNVDITTTREGRYVRVEARLHPGYAPCRAFFVQNAGILEHAPRLIGADAAEVEWSADGYSGVYLVRVPPSGTIWARALRRARVLFNTQATIQELTDQQTQLNRQNRELQAALKKAQHALATRDRFLQTIDHELRTPLNGIRGGLSALRSLPGCEESTRWIELIECSEVRLSDTIRSVLDYTRLESESIVPRPRDFRAKRLAESLRAQALHRAPEATVEIENRVPPKQWLRADDEQIERIARVLLNNALRFGAGAPVAVTIELDAQSRLRIEVRDRGVGIAPEDRARIFQPFVQLHEGEARAHDGCGLGLTIAAAIARSLGGMIEVESELGRGSTFIAQVPVERSERETEVEGTGTKILVVDDNQVNLMVATRMLRRLGCNVTTATDGSSAVKMFDPRAFDLVLMDCEMPKLDGWAATRKLREELGATTPVVAFTAYTSQADRRRCFDSGMNDFLGKPVSEPALAAMLDRWA